MLKLSDKLEINQISLTGIRSLVILGLLIVGPHSLAEIRQKMIAYNIMDDENSDDILRIDMNTLKEIGCEISRADTKNDGKYFLINHPFALKLCDEDIKNFKKVYKLIKAQENLSQMLKYDEFFRKIASYIYDSNMREGFLGILAFKHYDLNRLHELIDDCINHNVLDLAYESPVMKRVLRKQFAPQNVVYKNEKLYLHGIDMQRQKPTVLKVLRILKVYSRVAKEISFNQELFKVKYILKGFKNELKPENEIIVGVQDDSYIVEGYFYNSFYAMQRILSYGSDCVVLEPESFKVGVIKKLKEMGDIYET